MITWLASYPRSGNTLTRMILNKRFAQETYSLHGDRFDIGANAGMSELTGHASNRLLSRSRLELMRQSRKTYFIKTHRTPDSHAAEEDRFVYIMRDGRDVVCSYFNYLKNFARRYVGLSDVVLGQVPFGLWADHVRDWHAMDNDKILFLRYEDFIKDQDAFIGEIARFTGLSDSGDALPGFESLNRMNRDFFRRGTSAGWQQELSEAVLRLFWTIHGDVMRSAGYSPLVEDAPSLDPESAATLRRQLVVLRELANVRESEAEFQREATRLASELRTSSQQVQALQTNLETLRTNLEAMRNSTSWQITGPVRWLGGRWRRPADAPPANGKSA